MRGALGQGGGALLTPAVLRDLLVGALGLGPMPNFPGGVGGGPGGVGVVPGGVGGGDHCAAARAAAQWYGIDPTIFERLIQQESGFDPNAGSSAGARGIAQFMPGTAAGVARQLGIPLDRFWADPTLQLQRAAFHVRELLDMFRGDLPLALVGYNAGPGGAQAWAAAGKSLDWLQRNNPESRLYLRRILGMAQGGVIEDPTVGVNLRTGQAFTLAERGPERVLSAEQTRLFERMVQHSGQQPTVEKHYHITIPVSTLTPDEVQAHVERALTRAFRREQILGV